MGGLEAGVSRLMIHPRRRVSRSPGINGINGTAARKTAKTNLAKGEKFRKFRARARPRPPDVPRKAVAARSFFPHFGKAEGNRSMSVCPARTLGPNNADNAYCVRDYDFPGRDKGGQKVASDAAEGAIALLRAPDRVPRAFVGASASGSCAEGRKWDKV